jgi:hypothetical protein
MVQVYDLWCKANIGAGAKMDGGEGAAMKEISTYLEGNVDKNSIYIKENDLDLDKIKSVIFLELPQIKNSLVAP